MRAVIAILLSVSLVVTGCSKKDQPATGDQARVKVAFVPKLQGIPYFEAMNTGGQKAAKDLGIDWIYKGGTTADPGAQTEILKSLIQQKVDVLVVAPNDPDSVVPILADAASKGIKVLTSDTDAPNSVREMFVNQATADGIGKSVIDSLMTAMNQRGKFAIVSCGQTAANLNSWIDVQKRHAAEKYPDATLVDTVYAGEDEAKAVSMAKDLMNAHPGLTGLIGQCTASAPGVAKAVREAGKIGKVFTVGVGTPNSMKPYLQDGSSSAAVLWDVEQLGYLTAWAGLKVKKGEQPQATSNVSAKLPAVKYEDKTLLLGDPLKLTKDNVGDYDY
ncbi:autoinducer 2 ABC transporter substrate-binding protein [Kibdelosporangium phytohabitans]|uniref:Sugar ABC transporter substrate-binding protein n=1 Tax=Kibdelosporangium phytohabitans TaxID=860235 RepID=A0A0N9I2N5_9PSEU|nr:autoinducer 2 ABC transporter substrate-binding protein [Kibdelosporangium phytohabitans]ALG12915.1 sugar ABC transporter substrate-binding protein [Kibdelosporangium phytohabitans]MBE1464622.1 rhamnose transport system substrate-binding protein [Kibdelosporangium phytohabitans]